MQRIGEPAEIAGTVEVKCPQACDTLPAQICHLNIRFPGFTKIHWNQGLQKLKVIDILGKLYLLTSYM